MVMTAKVLKVDPGRLLVFDLCKSQEVIVHTPKATLFCPGDIIGIQYNGIMALSLPPQITATRIWKKNRC